MNVGAPSPIRPRGVPAAAAAQGSRALGRSFLEVLGEGAPRAPAAARAPAAPGSAGTAALTPGPPPSPLARGLARALQNAAAGESRIDAILAAAARGKTFTPAELIAMQATVFRYSQTIEVFSRAADRLVGAVKQTLGTQV
jgi:hypothetical protein